MQILGYFCLLIICCSVLELYKRFLQIFLGFLMMDCASFLEFLRRKSEFGFGFSVFGCLRQVCNVLGLFLMFGFGLKMLRHGCHCEGLLRLLCEFRGKSNNMRNGICADSKILSLKCNLSRFLKNSNLLIMDKFAESRGLVSANSEPKLRSIFEEAEKEEDLDEHEQCYDDEEEEFDVIALRKMIKIERQRANAACLELEKERMAAASAAEEAMAMILRLQNEKSSIEMEAQQFRRMAGQKQHYDQEVIQFLRGIVMKFESERSFLEGQLRLCRQKLKYYVKSDEEEGYEEIDPTLSYINSNIADGLDDVLISSLDMDLTP